MPNDDLAARLAELEDRVLDRLDTLELHNAKHCQRCLQAAHERTHNERTSELLADARRANESREAETRKLAESPHVRIVPVGSFVRGELREVTDRMTGRTERTRFAVDCRGHDGPLFAEMTELDWLALLAEDATVSSSLAKGLLRVEPMSLVDRIRFQRSHQRLR